MIRWHAELHIGKERTCPTVSDAIYSSINKDEAISGILQYIATMVEPDEPFKIVVKPINIKETK
jgi:hypothetical protein